MLNHNYFYIGPYNLLIFLILRFIDVFICIPHILLETFTLWTYYYYVSLSSFCFYFWFLIDISG